MLPTIKESPVKVPVTSSNRGSITIMLALLMLGLLFLGFEHVNFNTRQSSKLVTDRWVNQQIEDAWASELRMALSDPETCSNIIRTYSQSGGAGNLSFPSNELFTFRKIKIESLTINPDPAPHQIQNATVQHLDIHWSKTDSQAERSRVQRFYILAQGAVGPSLASCRGTGLVKQQILEEYICKLFGKVYRYGTTPETDDCVLPP